MISGRKQPFRLQVSLGGQSGAGSIWFMKTLLQIAAVRRRTDGKFMGQK